MKYSITKNDFKSKSAIEKMSHFGACHSERSEESMFSPVVYKSWILRSAQNDFTGKIQFESCPSERSEESMLSPEVDKSRILRSAQNDYLISCFQKSNKNIILFLLFFTSFSVSFSEQGTIDTVITYQPGSRDDSLKNNPYYPQNIMGIPSRKASKTLPANSREDIEAIGLSGEIIVGFNERVLLNGPGADFIIFENAFVNPVNNGIFAEPAIISVSKDGINFIEFPYDKTTLKGLAGLTPTYGDKDPFNPDISGGDAFDLDDLGLDFIKFIKIKDTTLIVAGLPKSHKYWNPEFLLSGFDLDAIVGLYLEDESTSASDNTDKLIDFKIYGNLLTIESINSEPVEVRISNLSGEIIYSGVSANHLINLERFNVGAYIVEVVSERKRYIYKFIAN